MITKTFNVPFNINSTTTTTIKHIGKIVVTPVDISYAIPSPMKGTYIGLKCELNPRYSRFDVLSWGAQVSRKRYPEQEYKTNIWFGGNPSGVDPYLDLDLAYWDWYHEQRPSEIDYQHVDKLTLAVGFSETENLYRDGYGQLIIDTESGCLVRDA